MDHAQPVPLAQRLTMIASGVVVATGCLGLAAILVAGMRLAGSAPHWIAILAIPFFCALGLFGLNLAWRGLRGRSSVKLAQLSDALLSRPATVSLIGGAAFLLGAFFADSLHERIGLGLLGTITIVLAFVAARAVRRSQPRPPAGLEQNTILQVLDRVRPRDWEQPTSRYLEAARAGELSAFGVLLALTAALDRREHQAAEELLTLGRREATQSHRYDFDLLEVMHLSLNVGDAIRARAAFDAVARDRPLTDYSALASASLLCVEGKHSEAAEQLERWQLHVEHAEGSAWLQAGNEWAEDAIVSRLEAAGAIEVVSRREEPAG